MKLKHKNKNNKPKIAVVIPCYRVKKYVLDVIGQIGEEVSLIIAVDDCCPENSGNYIDENCNDTRVQVLRHLQNEGVGGATLTGYQAAINAGAEIIVKIDGDGQMNPRLIPIIVAPLLKGQADYTKGNRFYDLEKVKAMPGIRLFGNAVLTFMNKFSSGYWHIFDPTNGYTAINTNVAKRLPFKKISKRYFFESDILFRLNILRAVVIDIPMDAYYGDEQSNLKVSNVVVEFLFKHLRNFMKRIVYNYYIREMSVASIELPLGLILFIIGLLAGGYHWISSILSRDYASAGTVMLAALPILMGLQLILAFLNYDIANVPKNPISNNLF